MLSMAVHPLVGWLTGDGWLRAAAFGVAPDPVGVFTLGRLLLATHRGPLSLLAVNLVWSLIGGGTAWLLDVPRDFVLPLAPVSEVLTDSMEEPSNGRAGASASGLVPRASADDGGDAVHVGFEAGEAGVGFQGVFVHGEVLPDLQHQAVAAGRERFDRPRRSVYRLPPDPRSM